MKAIPAAKERITFLKKNGYTELVKKFVIYDDYFLRTVTGRA